MNLFELISNELWMTWTSLNVKYLMYSSILNIISKVQNFTCDIFHVSYEGSLRKSILLYQQ